MRTHFGLLLATLLVLPLLAIAQIFTINPQQPSIGETVTLSYYASAPGATLVGKASLDGEALLILESESPVLVPIHLLKSGDRWTGSFILSDDRARLIIFRVVAGKDQDNGDGNAPFVMMSGKDGKPLMGANLQRGSLLARGGFMEFKLAKDYPAARSALADEKVLYPENWRVYPLEWDVIMREDRGDESRAKVKAALDVFYERFKGNGEALASALAWFDRTDQKERAESIRKAAIEADPAGPVAVAARKNAVFAEEDLTKRAEIIERLLVDFPLKGAEKEQMINLQINALVSAKQKEKALALLEKASDANMLNAMAWDWIEKGDSLEWAVKIAKRGVDLALNPSINAKPTYLSDEAWKAQNDYSAAMVLDTYGFGLYKLGRFSDAEAALLQAHTLDNGDNAEITERLLMACNKNGNHNRAVEVGKRAVERGKATDKLVEYYRAAHKKVKGSDQGFDAMLSKAKAAGAREMKEKARQSRLNKTAVPFILKDLAGKTVNLADMKGKVVVVDFWATWCGPCKSSFPALQKVYDLYRKNPSVMILALNTWENVSGKERETLVKKFMADNKYTFPVLYDEGYVGKYGVEGIPTKFVIDRKGKLAFKSIGFSGEAEMMRELTGQIDMLLAEKP